MIKIKKGYLIAAVYVESVIAALALIFKFGVTAEKKAEKIGFITTGDFFDIGWSAINYKGLETACSNMAVELVALSEIAEYDGSCPQAVDRLVDGGVGMIILNSYGYSEEMKDLLVDYPEIVFYGAGAEYEAANLTSYSSRLYQVRYLSGIVAGMQTKTGKIGFVAAKKDDTVCRGVNAFTLGVRRVNPDAEVIVAWTGSLDDESRETDLAKALIEKENIDVITYHQNRPHVIEVAEEYGIDSIGYYEQAENVSDHYLTCAMCDWTSVYEEMIREYLRG